MSISSSSNGVVRARRAARLAGLVAEVTARAGVQHDLRERIGAERTGDPGVHRRRPGRGRLGGYAPCARAIATIWSCTAAYRGRSWRLRRALPSVLVVGVRARISHHRPAAARPGRRARRVHGALASARGLRPGTGRLPHVLPLARAPSGGRHRAARGAHPGSPATSVEPRAAGRRRPSGGRDRRGRRGRSSDSRSVRRSRRSPRTTTGARDGVFRRFDAGADRRGRLQIPIGTVKTRTFAAMRKLRGVLDRP